MRSTNEWGLAILCMIALAAAIMSVRACAVCLPQKGSWDPVRGTVCYGEAPT